MLLVSGDVFRRDQRDAQPVGEVGQVPSVGDYPAAVEDAGQGVVVLLRERVELVVVAAGAGEGQPQETAADRVDLVIDDIGHPLPAVDAAPRTKGQQGGGNDPIAEG